MFRESAIVYIKLYVYVPATVMTYCGYLSLSYVIILCPVLLCVDMLHDVDRFTCVWLWLKHAQSTADE